MRRPAAAAGTPELVLRVDPVACAGIGMCAVVANSLVHLDRWGYPIVPASAVPAGRLAQARAAVRGCPRRALWLEDPADR